jgi:hypothetical protein
VLSTQAVSKRLVREQMNRQEGFNHLSHSTSAGQFRRRHGCCRGDVHGEENPVSSVPGFADEGGSQRMVIEGWICVDVEEEV